MIDKVDLNQVGRDALEAARTDRNASFYFHVFDYGSRGEKIAGKKILNVGAGDSNFSSVVNVSGGKVMDLDAQYAKDPPAQKNNKVAGLAQALPFADETFDETIASYSLYWITTGLDKALLEMLRVTKPGGAVKIYPVSPHGSLPEIIPFTSLRPGPDEFHTLTIEKDPSVSVDHWQTLIAKILESIKIDFYKGYSGIIKNRPSKQKSTDVKKINYPFYYLKQINDNLNNKSKIPF